MEYDMLEVKITDQVKVVPLRMLNRYRIIDQKSDDEYANCDRYFFEDGTALSGICKILVNGYYGAIISYDYDIKESGYIPALDMGKREDEIIIIKHLFITKDTHIFRVPKKRKAFYDFFINPSVDIRSYAKDNKINYRKEPDLIRILHYLKASEN